MYTYTLKATSVAQLKHQVNQHFTIINLVGDQTLIAQKQTTNKRLINIILHTNILDGNNKTTNPTLTQSQKKCD